MEFRFDPPVRRVRIGSLFLAGHEPHVFAPDELFQFGIEEEYFLSDRETFAAPAETPDALFHSAHRRTTGRIGREFLQAQIEVATKPHCNVNAARLELLELRQSAASAAAEHGLSILACGTHPLALWCHSVQTPKDRYLQIMDDLQMIGHRDMLCGTHIHVELPDPLRRLDVMTRMLPYVPLFIALSASSPFWQGREPGLRLIVSRLMTNCLAPACRSCFATLPTTKLMFAPW
jgi:carboxylate-amine ligase